MHVVSYAHDVPFVRPFEVMDVAMYLGKLILWYYEYIDDND